MKLSIANCEIDIGRHEFRSGGVTVKLEPQVFDLIVLLARNPGRLISRDELVEAIWHGRVVSDSAIDARIAAARKALGDDGRRQSVIATVPRRGIRMVADVVSAEAQSTPSLPIVTATKAQTTEQADPRVRFARSADGTRIAWTRTGSGPPMLRAGLFLGHVQKEWDSPGLGPIYRRLSEHFSLIRYDQRGFGLSDREPARLELDDYVDDLEAVADAAGLDRFALLGMSQGAAISIGFAARRPERVSRLVLMGGFVEGRLVRASQEQRARANAVLSMIREGWGDPDGPFLQAFATLYMPDATQEQLLSIVDIQHAAATPEMAVRVREAIDHFDVADRLERIEAPTLVVHATRDAVQPFAEGVRLAEAIGRAELLTVDSRNHFAMVEDPAWNRAWDEIIAFASASADR